MLNRNEVKLTEAAIEAFAQGHVWEVLISTVSEIIRQDVETFFADSTTYASDENLKSWLDQARQLPLDILTENQELGKDTFDEAFGNDHFCDPLLLLGLSKIIPDFSEEIDDYIDRNYPDYESQTNLITLLFSTADATAVVAALTYGTIKLDQLESGAVKPESITFAEVVQALFASLVQQSQNIPQLQSGQTLENLLLESGATVKVGNEIVRGSEEDTTLLGILALLHLLPSEQIQQIAQAIHTAAQGKNSKIAGDFDSGFSNIYLGG